MHPISQIVQLLLTGLRLLVMNYFRIFFWIYWPLNCSEWSKQAWDQYSVVCKYPDTPQLLSVLLAGASLNCQKLSSWSGVDTKSYFKMSCNGGVVSLDVCSDDTCTLNCLAENNITSNTCYRSSVWATYDMSMKAVCSASVGSAAFLSATIVMLMSVASAMLLL